MRLLGVDSLLYGVEDISAGCAFWTDFGLRRIAEEAGAVTFATAEGATVVLRPASDPSLPPAPVGGSTVREITWGVDGEASLAAVAAELGRDQPVTFDDDGTIHGVDPCGYAIAFRTSRRHMVDAEPAAYNSPGANTRIGRRAKYYERANPIRLAHVVLLAPEIEKMYEFYVTRLGFRLTDDYPGHGYFLRCPGSDDHHNLFLLRQGDAVGFHHVAFDVRDFHELFGGGLFMDGQGWETHLGPGRHAVSSAYFWYFRNPCGGAAEYDFDTDCVDDTWVPRSWAPTPESFAEWAYPSGVQRYGGRQTAKI